MSTHIEDLATVAQIAIDEYEQAGREHALLVGREMELEADRPAAKLAAVLRLMSRINPASGETQKCYSATAADSAASLDHEYRAYLRAQQEVVVQKNLAYAKAQSARLTAELAIARVRHVLAEAAGVA